MTRSQEPDGEGREESAQHFATMRRMEQERDDALEEASYRKDQVQALIKATKLLTRLVTNPRAAHQTTAVSNSNVEGCKDADAETRQDDASTSAIDGVPEEEKLLGDLLRDSKLDDSGFSALFNGCQMLRENLRLTAIEADDAIDEVRVAHKTTEAVDAKLRIASKGLVKLYKQNMRLKKERKRLAREVSEYVGELNTEKDRQLNEAYALLAHEQALSPMSKTSHTCSFPGDGEDVATALLAFPSEALSPVSMSLVTDEGAATVRFPFHDDDASTLSVPSSHVSSLPDEGNPSTLSMLGQEVVLENDEDKEERESPIPVGDLIGMLMCREEVDRNTYHIDFFSSHIGLKLRAIPARNDEKESCRQRDSSDQDYTAEISTNGESAQEAFVVCGFRDYDLELEKRPELGARLIAVDGTSVEYGSWSLKSVCDKIRSRGAGGGVRLSFRNDILSTEDIACLNKILRKKKKIEQPFDLAEPALETPKQASKPRNRKMTGDAKLSPTFSVKSLVDSSQQQQTPPVRFRLRYRKSSAG